MAGRVPTLLAIAALVGAACSGTTPPTATAPTPSTPGATAAPSSSHVVTPKPSSTPSPLKTSTSGPALIDVGAQEVALPISGIGSIATWGPIAWYTTPESHNVYRVDFERAAIDVVAEAGRGFPSSIDANESSVAWSEWLPKPGRHSSWRVITQVAAGDVPPVLVDKSTDTSRASLYDISPVLDLNGAAIAYTAGAPSGDNPLAFAVRYGSLGQAEPFHELETDLVPYDVAISDSGVVYSEGQVDPDAFGVIVDPKLLIYRAGSNAPQEVADDAYRVALDGDRMVWTSEDQVLTAIVGAADHATLSDSVSGSSLAVAAAEGLVTWSDATSDGRHRLMVWDLGSGATYQADESSSPLLTSIGGGWLAWSDGETVRGISIDELRASF